MDPTHPKWLRYRVNILSRGTVHVDIWTEEDELENLEHMRQIEKVNEERIRLDKLKDTPEYWR